MDRIAACIVPLILVLFGATELGWERATDRLRSQAIAKGNAGNEERCQSYQPGRLQVRNAGNTGWFLTDGRKLEILLDNLADAKMLLRVASAYSAFCSVDGLANRVAYWRGAGRAPLGPMSDVEDCNRYDPQLASIDTMQTGYGIVAGKYLLVTAKTLPEAERMLSVVRAHTYHCFVGRRNKRQENRLDYVVDYWR